MYLNDIKREKQIFYYFQFYFARYIIHFEQFQRGFLNFFLNSCVRFTRV